MRTVKTPRHRVRPDDNMQEHTSPPDVLAWVVYFAVLVGILVSAATLSMVLDLGVGLWVLTMFGAVIIFSLISLAVIPSIRRR